MSLTIEYGKRLIPQIIDQAARISASAAWGAMPVSEDLCDGVKDITYSSVASAINQLAWWIESKVGKSEKFETLAYIGPMDFRYQILLYAIMKTGHKILFPSPRNSLDGQLSLIDKTDCTALFNTVSTVYVTQTILHERPMPCFMVPELEELFSKDQVPHYPYDKSFEQAEKEPCVILHTSGTTGLPKPIVITHGTFSTADAQQQIPSLNGHDTVLATLAKQASKGLYISMPLHHGAGLLTACVLGAFWGVKIILGPAKRPISLALIDEIHELVKPEGTLIAPSIVEEICQSETSLEKLRAVKVCVTAGGAISKEVGDTIIHSSSTVLLNIIGSAEVFFPPTRVPDLEDWQYICYENRYTGIEWRPTNDSDEYELVFVKNQEAAMWQGIFHTFPQLSEYSMRDLYTKHYSKKHYWLYSGRADDIIVFSNGEKLNPITMEQQINKNPIVNSSIILGTQKQQPIALIELKASHLLVENDREGLLDIIWTNVHEANVEAPTHGQLSRSHIMFAIPTKPFLRTDKGTVKRQATITAYSNEIDALYCKAEEVNLRTVPKLNFTNQDLLIASIQAVFARIGRPGFNPELDFFAYGLDSLQVISFIRHLKASITISDIVFDVTTITSAFIYACPSITLLAKALIQRINEGTPALVTRSRLEMNEMEDLLVEFTAKLPPTPISPPVKSSLGTVVLISGTTGSLGSYLLDVLLTRLWVTKIYCLNRAPNGQQRQIKVSAAHGLSVDFPTGKVEFLCTDLTLPDFGLPEAKYLAMTQEATYIIHNSWPVDFNLKLSAFEPQIHSVLNLITFSASSAKHAGIFLVSSTSAFQGWANTDQKVPEMSISDLSMAFGGYSESKLVASLLLEAASARCNITMATCRIGQIAGPIDSGGEWNKHEWLPALIASSKFLGLLPQTLGPMDLIDWVPVDVLSQIVIELAEHTQVPEETPTQHQVWNVVNPHYCQWGDILPIVQSHFQHTLKVVSLSDWVSALQVSAENPDNAIINPGIKLLDWFQGLLHSEISGLKQVRFEVEKTTAASKTMQSLTRVNGAWMEAWLNQWHF